MPSSAAPAAAKSAPARAMEKLGLVRDIDLALHLPLRYEDETRIVPIAELREGDTAQVQGEVRDCRVEHSRSRRHLVARVRDATGELVLRWLHFYPRSKSSSRPGGWCACAARCAAASTAWRSCTRC
ncbi:MAG: hypothetical protein U1F25_11780 [Rubrivivax sp.]